MTEEKIIDKQEQAPAKETGQSQVKTRLKTRITGGGSVIFGGVMLAISFMKDEKLRDTVNRAKDCLTVFGQPVDCLPPLLNKV